jgi:hypothetical protein
MGVTGTALIYTLQGQKPAALLASSDAAIYCFTWAGDRISVGRVWVWPEPKRVRVLRALLDDQSVLYISEDQEVVYRDGTVGPITIGEWPNYWNRPALMPLYTGKTTHGYPTYRQIGDRYQRAKAACDRRRTRLVARMVYEWKTGTPIEAGLIVRHNDNDRTNCNPDNLRLEGKVAPRRTHPLVKQHRAIQAAIQAARKPPTPNNHRIVSVQEGREEEVYDLDTALPECSNIGVGGIFLAVKGQDNGTQR